MGSLNEWFDNRDDYLHMLRAFESYWARKHTQYTAIGARDKADHAASEYQRRRDITEEWLRLDAQRQTGAAPQDAGSIQSL